MTENNGQLHEWLAQALFADGRTAEAFAHFQRAAVLVPLDHILFEKWGACLSEAGRSIRRVPEYYANLIQHLNFRQSLHYPKGRFDGYDSQPMFPVSAEREFNLTVLDTLLTLTSPKNTTELAAR